MYYPCFLLEYQAVLCGFLQKFNEEYNVFFVEKEASGSVKISPELFNQGVRFRSVRVIEFVVAGCLC
jgi:hypothetical protein